ncbi:hypothetical protein DFH09DRAFT_1128660 [Mycena vulgaris]|nr:hypothetical protein DFH09DRAFT_1128660 [Mycena vulgaris]
MFLKSLIFLSVLAITNAADILTFKITDFQGSSVDLVGGSLSSLTPIVSSTTNKNKTQNWLFIYAAHGDTNEYRIINAAASSILSYSTADTKASGAALYAQIVGNQNVSTNWDVVTSNGSTNLIEKQTRLAMTAWPAGTGSRRSSPLTLEKYDAHNPHQAFKLVQPALKPALVEQN